MPYDLLVGRMVSKPYSIIDGARVLFIASTDKRLCDDDIYICIPGFNYLLNMIEYLYLINIIMKCEYFAYFKINSYKCKIFIIYFVHYFHILFLYILRFSSLFQCI